MPQYALGPWQWLTMEDPEAGRGGGWSYWGPPSGTIASVDLRPLADRERRTLGDRPYGLFLVQDAIRLPAEYQILTTDPVSRDAWLSLLGYRPEGDTVERCLYDMILHGDPSDADRIKPLIPTTRGNLDLHLGGLVIREQFRYGVHQHTSVVRDMVRREIRAQYEYDSARGDITLTRKVLDYELAKYRIPTDQWRELVQTDLQDAIQGPLTRTTAIADNFNRDNGNIANEPSSDGDWSWANIESTLQVNSNVAIQNVSNADGAARAEKDLSGSDQRVTIEVAAFGSNSSAYVGPLARLSSSSYTGYACRRLGDSASNHLRLYSVSSGTPTQIDASASQPTIVGIEVDSNSISSYNNTTLVNTVTDMAVSSGVRTGINIRPGGIATAFAGDNFAAEDLEAGDTFTATGSLTTSSQTLSGSATHDAPEYDATGSLTATNQTLSGDATFADLPARFGEGELQTSAQTLSGSATHDAPVFDATGSLTASSQTLSGAATFSEAPPFLATGSLVVSNQTLDGDAEFVSLHLASGSLIASPQSLTADATHTAPEFEATGSLTASAQTLSGTALFAAELFLATGSLSASSQTLSGSAEATTPEYEATGSLVVTSQVLAGVATFTPETEPLPDPVTAEQAVYDMDQWWITYIQLVGAGVSASVVTYNTSIRPEIGYNTRVRPSITASVRVRP